MTKKKTGKGNSRAGQAQKSGKKQHGGWIWSEGGLQKAYDDVKGVHDYIKDKKLISRGLPILGSIASVITKNPKFAQKGLEYGMQASQAGYGFDVSKYKGLDMSIPTGVIRNRSVILHGRGSHNQPNTSSFGSVKF